MKRVSVSRSWRARRLDPRSLETMVDEAEPRGEVLGPMELGASGTGLLRLPRSLQRRGSSSRERQLQGTKGTRDAHGVEPGGAG